jgi:hypothetical protein
LFKQKNPLSTTNFISYLSFWWVGPLLRLGWKRPLQLDDIWDLCPEESSEVASNALLREWEKESKRENPSIFRASWRVYGHLFIGSGIIMFLWFGVVIFQIYYLVTAVPSSGEDILLISFVLLFQKTASRIIAFH